MASDHQIHLLIEALGNAMPDLDEKEQLYDPLFIVPRRRANLVHATGRGIEYAGPEAARSEAGHSRSRG